MPRTLRLVLGDQLSDALSSLRDTAPGDLVLMAEVMAEATYVGHHKQKLVMVFAAMRAFAERLRGRGLQVRYVALGDPGNTHSLAGEVLRALEDSPFDAVVVAEPGEWRLAQAFDDLALASPVPVQVLTDDRFICPRSVFEAWAEGRRELRMEFFYRDMRRRTGLLMEGKEPVGGRWNFDAENRGRPPKTLEAPPPLEITSTAGTQAVMALVAERFPDNFGELAGFNWAVTAEDAQRLLDHFIAHALPRFGDFQDFMRAGEPYLWHARLSAAMNIGLLDPLEVCRRAEAAWRAGHAPLNATEGFIRQILGWREYVRGIYFLRGPEYVRTNFLKADRTLPWAYWTGETKMACVADVVTQTRAHAYAHHIQRLMVTGNLALLLGVHPDEVNDWYMVVFIDAFEWVEAPNTHGMAIFADGGVMASKPYAASGAYINRMSNYCGGCAYDVKAKAGETACPFNILYWDFLLRNEDKLGRNHRLGMPYKALAARTDHAAIRAEGERVRAALGAKPRVSGVL